MPVIRAQAEETGDQGYGPAHDLRGGTLLQNGVLEAQALDKDPDIQSEIYENLADIYRKLGDLPRAEQLLLAALDKGRSVTGRSSAAVAQTTGALAAAAVNK